MTFDEWRQKNYMHEAECETNMAKAAWEYQQVKVARLEKIIEELLRGSVA